MVYVSLYRRYRPQTFGEILGQEHVSTTLANAISEGRVAHAYLFTGPRGTGKTSTARILAKALNCAEGPTPEPCGKCDACIAIAEGSSLDVIEMDAASHSKVDETREILAGVPLATVGGRRKVYVIDEVHMLSAAAFNSLLKTLEEPPAHVVFVLATTEAHKVLPTIVSRTQRFDFRRVPVEILEEHLGHVAKREEIRIDAGALGVIARHAGGSVRDALSALDQLGSLADDIHEEDAEKVLGTRTEDALRDLFDAIAASDVAMLFRLMNGLISGGADVRQLTLGVLDHARSLLLLKTSPDAVGLLDVAPEDSARMSSQAEVLTQGALLRTLDLVSKALTEMRNSPEHRLLLEIALVRAAAPETDPSANGLLGRIERLERRMGIEPEAGEVPSDAAKPQPTAPAPDQQPAPTPDQRPAPTPKPASSGVEEPEPAAPPAADSARADSAEASTPRAAVPDEIGLGHVKEAWPATLKEVNKKSKRVWGLLSPSQPVDFDGARLLVEVQSEFHVSSMEETNNSRILGEAIHAALGITVPVQFVDRSQSSGGRPSDDAGEVEASEHSAAPPAEDPVELLKRGFGAEVVEEKNRE
jgi:DNA polymerase-3 subunit gamma/tau